LGINGSYSKDLVNSNEKSTKRKQIKVKKSNGLWSYDPVNQKIIFEKKLSKNDLRIVPEKYKQEINGVKYLTPVGHKINFINNKRLILYDTFHKTFIVYDR